MNELIESSSSQAEPFFSVCVPQFNRTKHLVEAVRVLSQQSFKEFEICISDDTSTDGLEDDLLGYLAKTGIPYSYKKQQKNKQYDENIREAIALARGKYCFLHGNDDCLSGKRVLEKLHNLIQVNELPPVVITNFEDWQTGLITERVPKTELRKGGLDTAISEYRNVAFVTGVLINRELCHRYSTSRWDGSEMYQMYLFARIVSEGGNVLKVSDSMIRKDIVIEGEISDTYLSKPDCRSSKFDQVNLPMTQIPTLIFDAISHANEGQVVRRKCALKITLQVYSFTYPFWIFEFRRARSWGYAYGFVKGIRPSIVAEKLPLNSLQRFVVQLKFLLVSVIGLLMPVRLFHKMTPTLYKIAKSF